MYNLILKDKITGHTMGKKIREDQMRNLASYFDFAYVEVVQLKQNKIETDRLSNAMTITEIEFLEKKLSA